MPFFCCVIKWYNVVQNIHTMHSEMHPELVFIASDRCHIQVLQLLYDALCYYEIRTNSKELYQTYNRLVNYGEVSSAIEDYCLMLLAKHEKNTRLPNSYEEWTKR
jgi:hypothetical protein